MSVTKAFRIVALALASILVPVTALAGTPTAPTATTKVAKLRVAKLKVQKTTHKTQVLKVKPVARPKLVARPAR
jgi:hypothetical protein